MCAYVHKPNEHAACMVYTRDMKISKNTLRDISIAAIALAVAAYVAYISLASSAVPSTSLSAPRTSEPAQPPSRVITSDDIARMKAKMMSSDGPSQEVKERMARQMEEWARTHAEASVKK
jgi:hypothetical protein